MSKHNVCIIGGSGFIGHSLCAQLTRAGQRVTVVSRHPERHRELSMMPGLRLIGGNVFDVPALIRMIDGHDAVINLVGILNEFHAPTERFHIAHVTLAEAIEHACRQTGVSRLLHMSALHADAKSPSRYLRTKAEAEDRVHAAATDTFHVTSFRPSVVFGPRDSFTNRFAHLLRLTPFLFPLACADSRFQPIYVEDLARAFVNTLGDYHAYGKRYDLCGPKVYSLKEIVDYLAHLMQRRTLIVGLGRPLSLMQAQLLQFAPGKPFTVDNYRSLQVDSVCRAGRPDILDFPLHTLEEIVPQYITPDFRDGFSRYRSRHSG